MREFELLAVVTLLEDVAGHGLSRGQVGTVVERLATGVYEVEFNDDDGRTYATLSLRADQLAQRSSGNQQALSQLERDPFA
jgi:hypothetical protein